MTQDEITVLNLPSEEEARLRVLTSPHLKLEMFKGKDKEVPNATPISSPDPIIGD